jgi:hypothetical protein
MKRQGDRRRIERRAPKRGVTVRHDDEHPEDVKRIRRCDALSITKRPTKPTN